MSDIKDFLSHIPPPLLSDNLISNPESVGRIRNIPVGVGNTVYTPLNIPQLLEDYFALILEKGAMIIDPFD